MNLVTLSNVVVRRRGRRLIGPVGLTIGADKTTVILGPNGSGKTTLLRAMHGLQRIRGGEVNWARDVDQAFVFQTPILLRRSVLANIAYPLQLRGQRPARNDLLARLKSVGLADFADRPAEHLSGGERQKLALARALVTAPQVVFLDEPTASLDGRSKREIEAVLTMARSEGTKLILATHDLGQARRLGDEVVFLLNGTVHETGDAKPFFSDPKTSEARAFLAGDIVE